MPGLRVPHIIRPNRSGGAPQSWIILDTETMPVQLEPKRWQHVFRLAVARYWRMERASKPEKFEREQFTTATALLDWITDRVHTKERIGIVAHNMDFDAQVLSSSDHLSRAGWQPTRLVYERGKWSQRWKAGPDLISIRGASQLWLDLCNFYPMSLRDAAPLVGMRKWRMPPFSDPDEVWFRHCANDVEIAYRLLRRWLEFRDSHELGYFAPTLAGQAFNAYRHTFMDHPIYVHIHKDVLEIERASYFAGRCEVFFRGRAPRGWYLLMDSTSFYASVMKGTQYPTKQIGHSSRMSVSRLDELLRDYCGTARVEVETEVPYFPFRDKGGTIFPVGRFVTTLSTPELEYGIGTDSIRKIEEAIIYERAPIFDRYVDYFWNLRAIGKASKDRWLEDTAKRLLTAAYGKFGQRVWLTEVKGRDIDAPDSMWIAFDAQDHEWYEYRIVGGRMEKRGRQAMGRDTLLAIPAHVTAYGRHKLWELISVAGRDHVYYVDTDGFICDLHALNRVGGLLKDEVLGGLRIVKQSSYLYIRARKWYELGDRIRRSGIKYDAQADGWERYTQDKFRSARWSLLRGSPNAALMDEVTISAPYRGLLPPHSIGHPVDPIRYPLALVPTAPTE